MRVPRFGALLSGRPALWRRLASLPFAFVLLAGTAGAQTSPPADEPKGPDVPYVPLYGGSVGFGSPFAARTRDAFGGSGISLAPGLGPVFPKYGLSLSPGFNLFDSRRSVGGETNKIFLLSLGPNFRYGLVKPVTVEKMDGRSVVRFRTFVPFVEAGVSLVYGDLSAHSTGISNKTLTVGGTFAIGTSVTKNAFLRATLRIQPQIDSYDFDRYGVELGVRF